VAQATAVASKSVSISNNNSAPLPTTTSSVGGGAMKRIASEMKQIQALHSNYYEVFVTENDMSDWKVIFKGPADTPYAGGHWMLQLNFPSDYPFKPMKLVFLTPIYHCNVSNEGRVCLSALRDSWSPSLSVDSIMHAVKDMLINPDTLDCLDAWKGSLARSQPEVYKQNAREHTVHNACGPIDTLKKQFNII